MELEEGKDASAHMFDLNMHADTYCSYQCNAVIGQNLMTVADFHLHCNLLLQICNGILRVDFHKTVVVRTVTNANITHCSLVILMNL